MSGNGNAVAGGCPPEATFSRLHARVRPGGRGLALDRIMLRILLVEDDDVTRVSVLEALQRAGHRVDQAVDGEQGLAVALAGDFDVVVCDVQMPKMDGLTLFRRLRRERPEWPIVIMTTFGKADAAAEALREGAAGYVTKPFDPDEFARDVIGPIDERLARQGRSPGP